MPPSTPSRTQHLDQLGAPINEPGAQRGAKIRRRPFFAGKGPTRPISERVVAVFPLADIPTYPLSQAVIVISAVADREEIPVLGIQDEQKAIEKDQRGLAHLLQRGGRGGCGDGAGQPGARLSGESAKNPLRAPLAAQPETSREADSGHRRPPASTGLVNFGKVAVSAQTPSRRARYLAGWRLRL